jgi:hypothetical protein
MNKSLTDKIIDASDQVSTDFKHNKTTIDDIPSHTTKEELETLKKFISDLYNQAVEKGRVNLEEKRVIRDMWGKKYILSKWYNKWYYRIMFKRAVNNYMMCAGEQYYIEHEFYNVFKPLENIEEILCDKIE